MEVSGQFHAPVALIPEKEPPVSISWKAGCVPEPVWTQRRGKEKKYPRFSCRYVSHFIHCWTLKSFPLFP